MTQPTPGQRWVSDTEPELGLGIVLKVEYQRVEMLFPAANELRQYALKTAPLRRVEFKEGDRIQSHAGEEFVVNAVEEKNGLLVYQTDKRPVPEAELSDAISFSKPDDRLLGGQVDDFRTFELRIEALQRRCEMRKSPVRGYL
ncbi:MAG: RNA polymerase-binding ATPase, partial [Verrucomicrobiaceae bacterium]